METEPHPILVAAVTFVFGVASLWLTRVFLSDEWLLGFVVAGWTTGVVLVMTRSYRSGGYLLRACAAFFVVAGFIRSVLDAGGRLEGGFAVMGGILLGISLTQFLTRRFEHPWMVSKKNGS